MRIEGWESRLAALVEARRRAPFEWGVNDCMHFTADAVEAITGVDPLAGVRATYGDEGGARALFLQDRRRLLTGLNNLGPRIRPKLAHRGDVALGPWSPGSLGLGVVVGANVCAPGPHGLAFCPLSAARCAWSVGRDA